MNFLVKNNPKKPLKIKPERRRPKKKKKRGKINMNNKTHETTSKTAELSVQTGYLRCAIDRLTIVGNLSDDYRNSIGGIGLLPWKPLGTLIGGGWRAQAYPDRKAKIYIEYDPDRAIAMGKRNFRAECNPNLMAYDQLQALFDIILPELDKVSISRLDLAFDFERSLHDVVFDKNVSGGKYWGKGGETQTIYYGAPSSNLRCRIYDKKAERMHKGDEEDKEEYCHYDTLWRIEYELTGSGYIQDQMRKKFHVLQETAITRRDYNTQLDVPLSAQEMIIMKTYDEDRELFNKLAPATKAKYRRLLKLISHVDLSDGLRDLTKSMNITRDKDITVDLLAFCESILAKENPLS